MRQRPNSNSNITGLDIRIVTPEERKARRNRLRMYDKPAEPERKPDPDLVSSSPSTQHGFSQDGRPSGTRSRKKKKAVVEPPPVSSAVLLSKLMISDVQTVVAHCAEIPFEEFLQGRDVHRVRARMVAICIALQYCGTRPENVSMVARAFKRDHSTVIHLRKRVFDLIANENAKREFFNLVVKSKRHLRYLGFVLNDYDGETSTGVDGLRYRAGLPIPDESVYDVVSDESAKVVIETSETQSDS